MFTANLPFVHDPFKFPGYDKPAAVKMTLFI